MTWTYSPAGIAASTMMQVRYLVGDTVATDPLVQDEEINFALSQRPSIYGAAAMACRSLAARMAREADVVDKDLRTTLSAKSKAFARMAADYENKASSRSAARPYAGGLSIADKIQNECNPDRVQPGFSVDMDTNYLPVAPVGNEGTPLMVSDSSDDNV